MIFYHLGVLDNEIAGPMALFPYATEQGRVRNRMKALKIMLEKRGFVVIIKPEPDSCFYCAIHLDTESKVASFITKREFSNRRMIIEKISYTRSHEELVSILDSTRNHKLRKMLDL